MSEEINNKKKVSLSARAIDKMKTGDAVKSDIGEYSGLRVVCGKHATQITKEISQRSKASGFNQQALDPMARQGYGNARFEVNSEEGLDLVEEFYTDEIVETEQVQPEPKGRAKPRLNQGDGFVQDIHQGLQGSVRAVN